MDGRPNRRNKAALSKFSIVPWTGSIKHFMTGPYGNREFCSPDTLNVPRGEAEGNIEVEGKQNSFFRAEPVIKCFVIPPNSKTGKNCKEIVCLKRAGSQICRGFKEHDLITCEA